MKLYLLLGYKISSIVISSSTSKRSSRVLMGSLLMDKLLEQIELFNRPETLSNRYENRKNYLEQIKKMVLDLFFLCSFVAKGQC